MASLAEGIYAGAETRIGGIRQGGLAGAGSVGYNYDWNPANQFDAAKYKAGPNGDLYLLDETPQDDDRDNNGGLYSNFLNLEIQVTFLFAEPQENPIREAQIALLKCMDDLKRLFGNDQSLGGTAAFDIWRPGKATIIYDQLTNMPAKLISPWRVQYSQQRLNPDLRG